MSTPHGPSRRGPDEPDERVLRDYRSASDALAEQPAAATRGAILAAAAREVQAAPRRADAPLGAPSPAGRTAAGALSTTRWPLAAAAAVLLSTLAVMLASRTAQEQPSFTAAEPTVSEAPGGKSGVKSGEELITRTDRVEAGSIGGAVGSSAEGSVAADVRSAGAPVPSTAKVDATPGTASPSARQAAPAVARPSVPEAAPAEVAREAAPTASSIAQQQPSPPARTNEARVALADASSPRSQARAELAAPAMPPSATPSPAAPAPLAKREAAPVAPAAEPVAESNAGPKLQTAERRRDMGATRDASAATKPSSVAAAAAGAVRSEADVSAADAPGPWLDRIVALRRAGQHDEADRELKRLRERYPQLEIPAAALPPVGTR